MFLFLGCLVSFVLKILYLFLYAIFKVHVSPATRYPDSFCKESGSHLLSHAVSSIVPSAAWGLTIVFGMGTGVSPGRIATRNAFRLLTVRQTLSATRASSFCPLPDT